MQKSRVLFFTPEALAASHMATQCLIARTLKELGHEVVFVRCFGNLTRCPGKDIAGAPFDLGGNAVREVCHRCIGNSLSILQHYGLDSLSLDDYLNQEDLAEIHQAVFSAKNDLQSFAYDGVPFGQICMRDLALSTKVCDFEKIDQSTLTAWILYIHGCLSSYIAVERMIKERAITHVVRFNEYATNIGAAFAGYKHKIPVITTANAMHLGTDQRSVVIMSELAPHAHRAQMKDWPKWENFALSAEQVTKVADDIIYRCGTASVHSLAKSFKDNTVLQDLGLSYSAKTLVAFTSSLDDDNSYRRMLEALGAPLPRLRKPFADQLEWLSELVRFVESNSEIQLIVRVEPFEHAIRSAGADTQQLIALREAFDRPISRCRFIWPQSPISSYDLIELADVGLTSWGDIGLEMARLGVPVLSAWHNVSFPQGAFLPWGGAEKETYFNHLKLLLNAPVRIDNMIKAFRCDHYFRHMGALDLSDVVAAANDVVLSDFRLPLEAKAIEEVIIGGTPLRQINLQRTQLHQRLDSSEREEEEMHEEMVRMIHYFLTSESQLPGDEMTIIDSRRLINTRDAYDAVNQASEVCPLLCIDGKSIIYHYRGRKITRFTPLFARLATYLECHYAQQETDAGAKSRAAQLRL